MLSLDLFNTKYERNLREGAVDDLEARRIDDLNMRMSELLDRAKESHYKNNPEGLAGLKREYQRFKDERDSYYKVREGLVTPTATGLRHQAKPGTYGGYEPEADPLARLDKQGVNRADKALGVKFNREKKYQGGLDVDEGGIPGNVPVEKIPGKEDLLKGKGRSYYEDQKKNLNLSKGVIPTEPLPEHGGGIGPRQHWQDLVPEQSNLENDDWYDDEDQETELRSGDYVRDTMDGEHGEIFRMQGDPYERRVRILDRDGKGWYIEPSRLTRVDPTDPDIQRYFGKNRQRDMDEGWSDAIVAQRTGQPRTPYSVYIKGRKWKDFENDDHARAVMDKLKAKFKADGRDPETITIAPTDMSEARATKTRLDPKCWTGKKIGNPKTKVKGGVRVNNCVPAESINEVKDTEAVEQAILKRIMVSHKDLLMTYGPEKIMSAASDVAYNVGDIGEVGSSDVSGWVRQVQQILGAVQQ
jgi:hypothetical protein